MTEIHPAQSNLIVNFDMIDGTRYPSYWEAFVIRVTEALDAEEPLQATNVSIPFKWAATEIHDFTMRIKGPKRWSNLGLLLDCTAFPFMENGKETWAYAHAVDSAYFLQALSKARTSSDGIIRLATGQRKKIARYLARVSKAREEILTLR